MEKKFQAIPGGIPPPKIFTHQLVTVDDLAQFRKQLLDELLSVLKSHINAAPKKWMRANEIRRLLGISPGTLQHLKNSSAIPHTKIGGITLYDHDDIQHLLESSKTDRADTKIK